MIRPVTEQENPGIAPTKKGDRSRPFQNHPNLVLVHLRTDQITDGGRTSGFNFLLGTQLFHRVFFVFDVFGLDGQADYAALTVDADDLGFDFLAFFQHCLLYTSPSPRDS